jgi:hypothetical protein
VRQRQSLVELVSTTGCLSAVSGSSLAAFGCPHFNGSAAARLPHSRRLPVRLAGMMRMLSEMPALPRLA